MNELQTIIMAIPIIFITTLVQLFKLLGMPSKYSPLVAFILALFFGGLFFWNATVAQTIVGVLMYGLGAVGLWEVGGKKIMPPEEEKEQVPIASEN